jgi:hypothetical protein
VRVVPALEAVLTSLVLVLVVMVQELHRMLTSRLVLLAAVMRCKVKISSSDSERVRLAKHMNDSDFLKAVW